MMRVKIGYTRLLAIAPLFGAIACGDDVEETGLSTGGGATGSTAGPTGGSETTHDAGTDATDATDTGVSDSDSTTDVGPCAACPANYLCWDDVCIPDLGPCETNDDCPGDSYCDDGTCVPYGVPEAVVNDPMCQKEALPDGVQPAVQCEWEGTEPGDPTAEYTNIYTTPIVADLKLGAGTTAKPSIIVTTWRSEGPFDRYGMLRVFDGATCEEQLRAGGEDLPEEEMLADRPSYGSQWAVGDLDGDIPDGGHPEIVGLQRPDAADIKAHVRLYAFRIDSSGPDPKLERAWYGRDCDDDTIIEFANGHANHGPSLIDLDDDGLPEVIFDEMVFSNEGCLLSAYSDFLYGTIGLGMMTAVLDVDLDERPDLVRHNRVAAWNEVTTEWENKEYFLDDETVQTPGHIGVANAGLYSDVGGVDPELLPEVVIVAGDPNGDQNENSGYIRMQDLAGSIVWGPISLYHKPGQFGGRGGPPTISDFDGDGQVEFATAGAYYFGVYDPDCQASLNGASPPERPGGTCDRAPEMALLPDGVLWAQPSQDVSSNITGSSIFDFDGDDDGEAVYRDECYLRVYDGKSGAVVFSAPAFSGTGLDYPVIADVDGDFATEIVVSRGSDLGTECPATDPLFPDAAPFESATGFVVLRDPMDRWAASRPVWNQHVYSVTNVTDDARIPRSSEVEPNWLVEGLNNFRQNVQGEFGKLQVADITVELKPLDPMCALTPGVQALSAEVCNRGTAPAKEGLVVDFLTTKTPDAAFDTAVVQCSTATTASLAPLECELVSCEGEGPGAGNLFARVDPDGEAADCHPGNNVGADLLSLCPSP